MGTRRQIGISNDRILDSPHGCRFLDLVKSAVGADAVLTPLDLSKRAVKTFAVQGKLGQGVMVEQSRPVAGAGVRLSIMSFAQRRWTIDESVLWRARLVLHRAEPALYKKEGIAGAARLGSHLVAR